MHCKQGGGDYASLRTLGMIIMNHTYRRVTSDACGGNLTCSAIKFRKFFITIQHTFKVASHYIHHLIFKETKITFLLYQTQKGIECENALSFHHWLFCCDTSPVSLTQDAKQTFTAGGIPYLQCSVRVSPARSSSSESFMSRSRTFSTFTRMIPTT